jgi:TPR repeat protein
MYDTGAGVPEDDAEAVKWYRLAADQGNAKAQYNLGFMYDTGGGVPEDDTEAVKWYRLAADQGHTGAQLNLGVMYGLGAGVPRNPVTAYAWVNVAAASGDEDTINARAIIEGQMTSAQIAEAQKLSTKIFDRIQQGN